MDDRNYRTGNCARRNNINLSANQAMTDPFVSFLRGHGVDANTRLEVPLEESPQRAGGHLTKWCCGCTNVWAAVEVRARCEHCRGKFERVAFKHNTNPTSRNGNRQDI